MVRSSARIAVSSSTAGVLLLERRDKEYLTTFVSKELSEALGAAQDALKVWEAILEAGEHEGVLPVGLAARDSLRFEACMPLYGHELAPEIGPVQARLTFALSLDKDFIGRDSLLKPKLEMSTPIQVLNAYAALANGG